VKKGKLEGYGELRQRDGSKLIGFFSNGLPHVVNLVFDYADEMEHHRLVKKEENFYKFDKKPFQIKKSKVDGINIIDEHKKVSTKDD